MGIGSGLLSEMQMICYFVNDKEAELFHQFYFYTGCFCFRFFCLQIKNSGIDLGMSVHTKNVLRVIRRILFRGCSVVSWGWFSGMRACLGDPFLIGKHIPYQFTKYGYPALHVCKNLRGFRINVILNALE